MYDICYTDNGTWHALGLFNPSNWSGSYKVYDATFTDFSGTYNFAYMPYPTTGSFGPSFIYGVRNLGNNLFAVDQGGRLLYTFTNVANADISFSNGATLENNSLSIASNSDGSMAKVYGSLTITNTNRNTGKITITSSLRPVDDNGDPVDLTINGVMIRVIGVNQANKNVNMASLTIKGNGNIEIDILQVNSSVTEQDRYLLTACNLYLKPFSDTPIVP